MIELVSNNVVLKGSHRRQILAWLRRTLHLGERLGDFAMKVTIQRSAGKYEVKAQIHDQAGDVTCRARGQELMETCRNLVHQLSMSVRSQRQLLLTA